MIAGKVGKRMLEVLENGQVYCNRHNTAHDKNEYNYD